MRLATIEQEVSAVAGGETTVEIREIGHVTHSWPRLIRVDGAWVENAEHAGEFIRLHLLSGTYKWSGDLNDYDVDTADHDPSTNPRWEKE